MCFVSRSLLDLLASVVLEVLSFSSVTDPAQCWQQPFFVIFVTTSLIV